MTWVSMVLSAFLFCGLAGVRPAVAEGEEAADYLNRLASIVGHDPRSLEVGSVEPEVLIDGRRIVTVKAVGRVTGETFGVSFDGEVPVDRLLEKQAAAADWRSLHGALTPAMVATLDTLADDIPMTVAVWLVADIEGLPKPEPIRRGRAPAESGAGPGVSGGGGAPAVKAPSLPVADGDVPVEVRSRIRGATWSPTSQPEDSKPIPSIENESALDESELEWRRVEMEAARDFDSRNLDRLRASVTPLRDHLIERLDGAGIEVLYASDLAPMAVLSATKAEIESLAFWPELDAVDPAEGSRGPSLATARPTQNADLVNTVGYTGVGVTVAVTEGERIFAANPFLAVSAFYDGAQPFQAHPTAVGGMIASTHDTYRGLASGADLVSANGSYTTYATMSAAMDWGSAQAQVLNNSWYWDPAPNNPLFWEADRHQDYFVRYNYDFVAVAAGNFGNGCTAPGGFSTSYVVSPAKGYNVMSVGNFDDLDTLGWPGDVMHVCSSFGDPGGDSSSTHAKPEISGVGSGIISTTTQVDPALAVGAVGSGTSYSSPMVAATAATLIEADPSLGNLPEALKAVLMASALHNIEGAARFSDIDGAGGMVSSAAAAVVERGDWNDQNIGSGTTFPLSFQAYAYAGEVVRFAIVWLSNPDAGYTADQLPADLDLYAYRDDGTTLITSSTSSFNGFEIVEFVAPATEIYRFKVSLFGSWNGGSTWLGAGWWRGIWRIGEEIGYSDPEATPLGTHLVVHPADGSPFNYWRVLGIRPDATSDHDLTLRSASYFEDPATRQTLADSTWGTGALDFVVVDGNHWSSAAPEHYRVNRYGGSGGYRLSRSNLGELFSSASGGTYGPFSMSSTEVVKVFDVSFPAGGELRLTALPTAGTPSGDIHLSLFKSDPGNSATWAQSRTGAVAVADAHGVGIDPESLTYQNTTASSDYLGLVVANKRDTPLTFYIVVENTSIFSDGFESNSTAAWTLTTP
jgi:hypothetical protein